MKRVKITHKQVKQNAAKKKAVSSGTPTKATASAKQKKKKKRPSAKGASPNKDAHKPSKIAIGVTTGKKEPSEAYIKERKTPLSKLRQKLRKHNARGITRKPMPVPSSQLTRHVCAAIRLGNWPETAARAFGIQAHTFRGFVKKGFEAIMLEDLKDPYAQFVMALDQADAQSECLNISQIATRTNNWQALAWLRERRSGSRFQPKVSVMQPGLDEIGAGKEVKRGEQTPEIAGQIAAILEEAGVITVASTPIDIGSPDEVVSVGEKVKRRLPKGDPCKEGNHTFSGGHFCQYCHEEDVNNPAPTKAPDYEDTEVSKEAEAAMRIMGPPATEPKRMIPKPTETFD